MIDSKVKARIEFFAINKINDFSPTISPAPKNKMLGEIESLTEAIEYFAKNGITEIVIQKKYMGSYCSIYLHKNLEETYFVSRNGYKIRHIDLTQAVASLKELHATLLQKYANWNCIIIGSEMLPWSAMGKGLIDNEYGGYYDALQQNFEFLETGSLINKIDNVKNSDAYKQYIYDKNNLEKSIFKANYKSHIIRQYDAIEQIAIPNLTQRKNGLEIFKKQLDYFGLDSAIYFKPFVIFKLINNDGSEIMPNSNLTFSEINDDAFLHIKIDENHKEESMKLAYEFYKTATETGDEGIMVKPVKSFIEGIPPAFKVRNNNYLSLVYGVNFNTDFEYYLNKRNIKEKLKQSILDWKINYELLKIPMKEINEENYFLKLLVLKRIEQEEIEKGLDGRL